MGIREVSSSIGGEAVSDLDRKYHKHDNCSCHISPPCGYCTGCEICNVGEDSEVGAFVDDLTAQLATVTAERDTLAERLEDTFPATWAGLGAFLDHWYPADIFAQGNDPGPRIIRLTRELSELRASVERAIDVLEEIDSTDRRDDEYLNTALAILKGNAG